MRTTVTADDALLHRAAEAGRTLSELPVFTGSGLQPGVDLEDKDALLDLLDEDARAEG